MPLLGHLDDAAAFPGFGMIGLERYRSVVARKRIFMARELAQSAAEIVPAFRERRR
jgi:hypothetical protein